MNYTDVLKDSFAVFWKYKSLWLFGVMLAVMGKGQYGFSANYRESTTTPLGQSSPALNMPFREILSDPQLFLLLIVGAAIAFWLVSNFVASIARGALIGMVGQAEAENTTSLGNGWDIASERLWRVFGISSLLTLPSLLLIVLVAGIFAAVFPGLLSSGQVDPLPFAPSNFFAVFFSTCALICVGGIVGIVLNGIEILALRACVLEKLPVGRSIARGWQLLVRHLGYSILNAVVLGVAGIVYGMFAAIPALALLVPVGRAFLHQAWSPESTLLAIALAIYYMMLGLVIGGILTSYNEIVWTKLFSAFIRQDARVAEQPGTPRTVLPQAEGAQ